MDIGNFSSLLLQSNASQSQNAQQSGARLEALPPQTSPQLGVQSGATGGAAGGPPQLAQAITVLLSGGLANALRRKLRLSDDSEIVMVGDPENGDCWLKVIDGDGKVTKKTQRMIPLDGRLRAVIARYRDLWGPLFDLSA